MHDRARDIVEAARTYVGTRYRHQGRSRETAVDCVGLLVCVAHDIGLSDFDTDTYSKRPDARQFRANMLASGCTPVRKDRVESGDILRVFTMKWPVHLAILDVDELGLRWMIHAYAPARKVVRERLTDAFFDDHVCEGMRYPA